LHAELARIGGSFVDPPLAVHIGHGWLLTRDRGPTLAERGEPTLAQWCALVQEAARLQRHVARLPLDRDTGVVDCSPATVLPRFDTLLERYAALPPSNLCHLPSDQLRAFQTARPTLEEAVAVLTASSFPVTLNHGDLHSGNVLIVDGKRRPSILPTPNGRPHPKSSEPLGAGWYTAPAAPGGRSSTPTGEVVGPHHRR
jgi:hypothetical protein